MKIQMPNYEVPSGYTQKSYFLHLVEKGLNERLQENNIPAAKHEEYRKRLKVETDLITNNSYENYMLIVWDYVAFAHKNDILTAPVGSVAGLLAAYALKITDIDPIQSGLFSERFMNPLRPTVPDIDINFCADRIDEVIAYLRKKYKGYIAQVDSSDFYQPNAFCAMITEDPLTEYFVEIDDSQIIAGPHRDLERFGMIIFDLIPSPDLTYIAKHEPHKMMTPAECIDSAVYENLSAEDFVDVEQLVNEAELKNLVNKIRPSNFNELIALYVLAIPYNIRRGITDSYCAIKNMRNSIKYIIPQMEEILSETYGLLLYQEQFMQILHSIGGYQKEQTDIVRRGFGKMDMKFIDMHKEYFIHGDKASGITGACNLGIDAEKAEAVYAFLKDNHDSFLKSHCITRAILTYNKAYLRQKT